MRTIYTIGHSTRPYEEFVEILVDNGIRCLVDVRSYPGSRRYPQFDQENLEVTLPEDEIEYIHVPELGGRRRSFTSTIDTSLRVKAFSSYAEYMRTPSFEHGLRELEEIGEDCRTAIMCSEAVYWSCHRRMISDRLTVEGWRVLHLGMGTDPLVHELWDVARVTDDGELVYDG